MVFISVRRTIILTVRKQRNWWRLLYALIFAVLYQCLTRLLGWTHETSWLQVFRNGSLTWVVFSTWFVITGLVSIYLPMVRRWWGPFLWLGLDWLIQLAALLATGWLFQTIMQLMGTSAPGGWWLYTLIAIPHILFGWELRRQINRE